jgi:hypothetical protein
MYYSSDNTTLILFQLAVDVCPQPISTHESFLDFPNTGESHPGNLYASRDYHRPSPVSVLGRRDSATSVAVSSVETHLQAPLVALPPIHSSTRTMGGGIDPKHGRYAFQRCRRPGN